MNKRQIQKEQTRKWIVEVAKKCFVENGFLNTTTATIAKESKVAHGTLFLHFPNKESLIMEILDKELNFISEKIYELISENSKLEIVLDNYLKLLQNKEKVFSVLARELPFYSDELRRKILFRESIIRSHFFNVISFGIANNEFKKVDPTMAVSFLFNTIHYYLSMKAIFVKEGSVIEKFKDSIKSTFLDFLTVSGNGDIRGAYEGN